MLLQLMIGIVVIVVISSIVALNLTRNLSHQALTNTIGDVSALIEEARSRTLSGDHEQTYGVHLESTKAVLFSGTSYDPSALGNKTVKTSSGIVLDSITLAGGGSEILFDAVSGDTDEDGTFIVKKATTDEGEKMVTVTHAGQVSSN